MSDLGENSSKFEKMLKDPIPLIGMGGFIGVVAYSIYNYRNKSSATKTSVYVIQTRVAAQSLVIGMLTLGIGYRMISRLVGTTTTTDTAVSNTNK